MSVSDLIFLVSALMCGGALLGTTLALTLRHWSAARRLLIGMGGYVLVYSVTLVSVAALSPQRTLAMGQERCFDDWCISAVRAVRQSVVGSSPSVAAQGSFVVVTVRVTSHAKGISQRAVDASLYALDSAGRRYDISPAAQRALDAAGQAGQPLDTELAPGASFTGTVAFDTPVNASGLALVVSHGAFPGVIIVGDEQSIFHRPTLMLLTISS